MSESEKINVSMDTFGDQVKSLESKYAKVKLDDDAPFCVRIDGKNFSTYTHNLKKPYDERLSKIMIKTMNFLLEKTDAKLGYTQSDEISLVFFKTAPHQQHPNGAKIQKLTSILASLATAYFNHEVNHSIKEKEGVLAFFDARVWSVPTLKDAADVFVWRQDDAIKNSISMAASAYYKNHKHLQGKSSKERLEMLKEKGIDWEAYPDFFKSGTYAMKRHVQVQMDEVMKSHKSNAGKDSFLRTEIFNFSAPRLKRMDNYEQFLFDPIFEEHKIGVKERNSRKMK